MSSIALLSWRVVAEIAMSDRAEWLEWLADRRGSGGLLVSQFSLIKASSFIQKKLKAGPISPNGLLERFAKRHLLPHNVVDARNVSPTLYNVLARRHGKDDLELLSICIALQNHYEYYCWDSDEVNFVVRLAPKLVAKLFETVDGVRSS